MAGLGKLPGCFGKIELKPSNDRKVLESRDDMIEDVATSVLHGAKAVGLKINYDTLKHKTASLGIRG